MLHLGIPVAHRLSPMALLLGDLPWVEQVELDFSDDVGDAGLAGLAGGEVTGLLGFAGLARSGRSRTRNPGMRIFSRNVAMASSGRSGGESRHGVRCGGQGVREADPGRGMPAAFAAIPTIVQMAW